MKKLMALIILCLSMSAMAESPAAVNDDDTNLKSGRHEEARTEGGTLATGQDSDCPSCKASQEVNGTLSNFPQSPKAAASENASTTDKSSKSYKGRK